MSGETPEETVSKMKFLGWIRIEGRRVLPDTAKDLLFTGFVSLFTVLADRLIPGYSVFIIPLAMIAIGAIWTTRVSKQ